MRKWPLLPLIALFMLSSCGRIDPGDSASIVTQTTTETYEGSSESFVEPSSSASEESKPSRPHRHAYEEESLIEEATLFEPGLKRFTCECGDYIESAYYKLDECSLDSQTFQYDGKPHHLRISGLLPLGVSVRFIDNERTEIGSQEVKAEILALGEKLDALQATLTVEPYAGFPNIKIDTGNVAITNKETYVPSLISLDNSQNEGDLFSGVSGGIRLRGNGTLNAEKKPYRIKFDKKRNILGLNQGRAFKSWVLLAEFYDYSMQRNATAFHMGKDIYSRSGGYCSDFAYVNLYLNGIYNGLYVLAEQNQAGKGRFDVYEPEETDLGSDVGYLVELDDYARTEGEYFSIGGSLNMVAGRQFPIRYYAIKTDYFSKEQFQTAEKTVKNAYEVLLGASAGLAMAIDENGEIRQEDGHALSPLEAIGKVIDLPSLFKMAYIEEIMKDIDVGFSSFFLYFDFSEGSSCPKVTFGSPWDFDWSSGNVSDASIGSPQGLYCGQNHDHANPWLYLLAQVNGFKREFGRYYRLFAFNSVAEEAMEYGRYITDCFKNEFNKNFAKWPVLGTAQHGYHPEAVTHFRTHEDASSHLLDWLGERMAYLDGIYGGSNL